MSSDLNTPSPRPQRKNRLPMIRNSGIGVSPYTATALGKFDTICSTPVAPPKYR